MDENKNSDFKNKSNSVDNSNARLGLANFRPGSSNSNPRPGSSNSCPLPGSSNSNPRPGPSNSNSRPSTSCNNWQERDRDQKFSKKRSHSENDDSGRDNKIIKTEILDIVKNEENFGNKKAGENGNDDMFPNQEIALAARQLAIAITSMYQRQMTFPIPQQMMFQPAIPYQRPVNHTLPTSASSVGSTSGIGMPNGIDIVSPTNGCPYMSNSDGSLDSVVIGMPLYSYPPISTEDALVPVFNNLEPIIINHAVLTPPRPGETRTRREKPPGCRTVFVGNLPEKITEEIIRDAFKLCGPISIIRMSKKNFCHIRFANMESVEQALLLSGFRIRIDGNEDSASNSELHVDYASARDDQHDHECQERARLREERYRQQEAFRPPSPPPIPHFSDSEYTALADRLRKEETFKEALQVLITWLDRGECNKKNSGSFFSLIQSSHNHVKRLRNEKSKFKEAADKANENLLNKNRSVESEVNDIEKVFVAARTQKVWDHFTRSQRKKMEEMKSDTQDLKQTNSEDLVVKREEEEMDMSDTEDRNDNEDGGRISEGFADINALREKANNLAEELETANQAIEDAQFQILQQHDEILRLKLELKEIRRVQKTDTVCLNSSVDQASINDSATQSSPSRVDASENENYLISLVSIFLQVLPFGASIDYICSYLVKMASAINARDVESLLRKFPSLFKEVSTGIGATLEKKWIYVGFNCRF